MNTNDCFQIIIEEQDVINSMLCGGNVSKIVTNDTYWVTKFNSMANFFDLTYKIEYETPSTDKKEFIDRCINGWHIPTEYISMDIENHIILKCKNKIEQDRVYMELREYKKRNLYNLLKFMVYFVDTLRKNDVIWGVGRGSSVASFVLYLIGIHRINSIKYNLDIGEFLK